MSWIRRVAAGSVALVVGAVMLAPTAGAWPTPNRVAGVSGVRVNGSGGGDGLSYLGLYGINPSGAEDSFTGVCVMWEGGAPNPANGAYDFVGTIGDPILSNAVAQMELLSVFGGSETDLAAYAVVAKYRSNQLGLPGATIYGPGGGPGNPTGPGSFLLSDGTPPPTEYNSGNPTSAAAVAAAAWTFWQRATAAGINWSPTVVAGAHPGTGTMSATVTVTNSAGGPVASAGVTPTVINGTGVSPAVGATNAAGQVTFTWTVSNPALASGLTASISTPIEGRMYRPNYDAGDQTIVGAPDFVTRQASDTTPAPTGTVRIEKLNNQTGAHVAGATLQLRFDADNNGSYETTVGNYTSTTSATVIANRLVGNYQLIETAAPAGYQLDSTPTTGALTSAGTLTLAARNNEFGEVKVEKRSIQTGAHVAGATLRLRYDADNNGSYETTVGTYTSGSAAITVANRPAGNYELVETAAPAGYDLNSTPVIGALAWGGTLTVTARNNKLGEIQVEKIDGVNGDPVAGALLRLTGPAPATTVVWEGRSGTSPITVPNLRAGTYTLTELEAPAGYHVAEPATTTLAWGDTATVALDNFLVIGGETTASETIATTDGTITEIYDSITLTGVHADQTVSVTAVLYSSELVDGPLTVDLADNICSSSNEAQRITVDVTGPGPHLIGPFAAPAPGFRGLTTFADGVTGAGPQSWLDHCGQPNETVEWVPPIVGATQAMDIDPASNPADEDLGTEVVSTAGTQVWDRVTIDGLATGETATITATLFSDPDAAFPFTDPVSANACVEANQLGETITITVTGTNDADTTDVFTVGPFSIPEGMQGRITFADTVSSTVTSGDDEPRIEERDWADTCGQPSETLTVRRPLVASTTASVTTTIDGQPIADPITSDDQLFVWDSITTNLNEGETGTVIATAYGYFPADTVIAADACVPGMVMQTFTLTVTGPGPHLVGPVRTDARATGQVTWRDGITADVGEDTRVWSDSCGTPAETKTIRRPITAITTASHSQVTNTGDVELWDEVTVDGLEEGETAVVVAKLYGPYSERPTGDSCGRSKLLATFNVEVTGPGPHRVGPYRVPADMVGYVTWQDGVTTEGGRSTLHGCGLLSETTEIVAPEVPVTNVTYTSISETSHFTAPSTSVASAAPAYRLATTGSAIGDVMVAAAALCLAGAALLMVRRRRWDA